MSSYDVCIRRISPHHNYAYRYEIVVWWDKKNDIGARTWTYTLWGAHRAAKELVKKHENQESEPIVIEEYKL